MATKRSKKKTGGKTGLRLGSQMMQSDQPRRMSSANRSGKWETSSSPTGTWSMPSKSLPIPTWSTPATCRT